MVVSDHWIRFFIGFVEFVRTGPRPTSDIEADRAHEFESVALLDDTLPEGIIEMHYAPFQVILEVDVVESTCALGNDLGQRKVMGRDNPQSTMLDKSLDHGLSTDSSIMGVCSVQDLVQQKERRGGFARDFHDLS